MSRYLSGLCVAGLGLCGGGWLVAAVAFGGESARHGLAGRVNLLTGASLIAVSCLSLVCWSFAWRQRLRADGVLADQFRVDSRREARRDRRELGGGARLAAQVEERPASDATGSQPALGEQTSAPALALPQRTPSASAFRPGATSVRVPVPRVPVPRVPLPRAAVPDADDGRWVPIDSQEGWR